MNRTELVAQMAEKAGVSKKAADDCLKAFTESIMEAAERGDDVQLVGFGTFKVSERAARTGVNPKTKEKISIAASKMPAFRVGKAFKDRVNR